MSLINNSFSSIPYELLVRIFEFLPHQELLKIDIVCGLWHKAALFVVKENHKHMFHRIIKVLSSAELTAKEGPQKLDFKSCPCEVIKRLVKAQKEEIEILLSDSKQQFRGSIHQDDTRIDDPETFFLDNRRAILDYNIGIALFKSGYFLPNQKQQSFINLGIMARHALENKEYHSIAEMAFRHEDPESVLMRDLLGFSSLNLTEFPSELISLLAVIRKEKLMHLVLNDNQLSFLPPEISLFPDLEILELTDNAFTFFPETILKLEHLQVLELSGNPLSDIPKEIADLKELDTLNLTKTSITSLPKEIASLPKLKEINLIKTGINSFPEEIMLSENQELVNAMVPHLFADLVLKLCEHKKEEFYDLIRLLPETCQESIYHDYFTYHEIVSLPHMSREEFWSFLADPYNNLSAVLLIKAFINSIVAFHVNHYNPMKYGNTLKIREFLKVAMESIAHWTLDEFEKAKEAFLSSNEKLLKDFFGPLGALEGLKFEKMMNDNPLGYVCICFRFL